jgi:hypothetical protein
MPVWKNVKKVIIIPDDPEPNNWWVKPLGIVILVLLALWGMESCAKKISGPSVVRTPDSVPPPPLPPPPQQKTTHFLALGPRTLPAPVPTPAFLGRKANGDYVFGWQGRQWFLPPPPNRPYRYLCVTNGLSWCWQNPPRPFARTCTRKSDGTPGWCWEE